MRVSTDCDCTVKILSSVSRSLFKGGSVSLEAIQENARVIRDHIDLPSLLPSLRSRGLLSEEQLSRLSNPAQNLAERTTYLLQLVIKFSPRQIDVFVACLKDAPTPGHQQILNLLEESSSEQPPRSPLLDVFQTHREDILSRVNFPTLINKMVETEVISVHENMTVYNPHSSLEENCAALVELLVQRPGATGLLKFIECLQQDANTGHTELANILLQEAASVAQTHPRRGGIPQGDKTQLLLLERWREVGTPSDMATKQSFKNYEARLGREVKVGVLMPHLLKKNVLTREEEAELNGLPDDQRAARLVAMVGEKGMRSIVSFVECIKQSSEHEKLARLFDMGKRIQAKPTSEKTSKLAVLVCMDTYLELTNDYEAEERRMSKYNPEFEEHRDSLLVCLERLQFTVIDSRTELSQSLQDSSTSDRSSIINTFIDKEVVPRCNKDAIVFIYITGHQFPLKTKEVNGGCHVRYSGAVLTDGASVLSRRECDCIDMGQLKYWAELLPTDNVTFLIDCHFSHIVSYGKQRLPSEVEIMTSPWSALTGSPGVVLFFCQPDAEAMWRLRGTYNSEDDSVFGKLTELFVKALISWIRRGQKVEVSHRLFYESISFHWHKRGRVHKRFKPAIQGDVDRSFLGTSSFPYLQVIRADLVPSNDRESTSRYDLTKLQVATGTHLGLIKDDELLVFHILHPEMKVWGKVVRAHPLSAVAEVREGDREKFSRLLNLIYEEEEESTDGSTEFVLLKKKFPVHLRDNYTVYCQDIPESDTETIKNYIKTTSQLLSYAHNLTLARLVVTKRGQFFTVEDRETRKGEKEPTSDIIFKPHVKTIQNVKSVLEIMAWFKHVKNLRSQTDLNHFLCYLICEKPLLSHTSSPTDEYTIKASSQTGPHPPSEAILHFSDNPYFWSPTPQDSTPTLEVEFSRNRVVTAVELRGDPDDSHGYIKKAELSYQKLVFHRECSAPHLKGVERISVTTQEKAWFITFKPVEWESEFCLALRVLASVPGPERGKLHTQGVSSMTVLHWNYLCDVAGWSISPQPIINQAGHALLDLTRTENMLQWNGRGHHPITFDLGGAYQVVMIEIARVPGTSPLRRFRVELCNQWLSYDHPLPPLPSSWPHRHNLRKPLVLSHLQLCPTDWGGGNFKAQLQLYGNADERRVVAEERDILQLHFVNYTKQCQFVYVYYLEETGKIEIVLADIVPPKDGLKKLFRVYIPDGYEPVAKKITDQYRILVSPKKIYLEPLDQLGLHEYLGVRCYNPCYIGRRTDIGKDEQWNEYKFEVVVRRGGSSSSGGGGSEIH